MEIFEAFVAYLNNYKPLTDIIGSPGVFPDLLPKEKTVNGQKVTVTNGIVYNPSPGKPDYDLNGLTDYESDTFQFATYALSNKEACSIYKKLKDALSAMKGIYGELEVQFVKCNLENIKKFEADTGYHSYKSEWIFYYNR